MKSKRILIFSIFALAVVLAVLFSGCIRDGEEEPSGEISMTDIDKMASEITENVNLNDPTVSISTKLLADDPSKEIELESVDVTTIQYVYNFSITADRTMDDTLVVVGKDASGEIVYNKTEQIHLESGETQFFMVYIPLHKSDGQIIEDLTLTFKTLDEETREVKTKIKTEKKPYAVSDELKETFASFDGDKDGTLSESERQTWWDWVEEHVEYMTDKFDDYTKMPDETVYEEGGDCEDMAVLNAEFYKSHGYEVQVGIVATEGSDGYNHVLTRVKIGDEWVTVDNAAGSELGDTIKVREEPYPVDYSLELFFRATVHPIKVRNIDGNVNGYDIDEDGKADIVTRDSDNDGVVDAYEFYKDGKKIQERHFEDGELIKTNYYDEEGNLISGETPEPEGSPKIGGSDEYKSELKRVHDKLVELDAKSHEQTIKEGEATDRISMANYQKQKMELYANAYYEEQKISPPKGAEDLHNNFLKYLQCRTDMNKYYMTLNNLVAEGDYPPRSIDYYSYKASVERDESIDYYNKLVDDINKNIPSELTSVTISTKHKCQSELTRVQYIKSKIDFTSDDEQMKKAYEQVYSDEQKITPPEGTEYIHNNFLKYLQCEIDAHDYAIKAKAAGSEYIAFRKRYQGVMQQISDLTNAGLGDSKEAGDLREELIRMSSNPPSPPDEYILYSEKAEKKHKETQEYWNKIYSFVFG